MPEPQPVSKKTSQEATRLMRSKLVLIMGLMLIFALYFWGHNVEPARSVLMAGLLSTVNAGMNIGLVAILALIGGGIGQMALSRLDLTSLTAAERLALTSLVGLGSVSLLTVILGLLGLFNIVIWAVVLVIGVLCRAGIRRYVADVRLLLRGTGQQLSVWERFAAIVIAVLLVMALIIALAPATGWDAIYYHLVIPQRYINTGIIGAHTDIHFFGFPQNTEMLYGLLMMVTGSGTAAAVLHYTMGLFAFLAIGGYLYRQVSRSAALTIILLMVMSFGIWKHLSVAYVDIALMAYGAVAVIAITQWVEDKSNSKWLILSGVIAGLAVGVKYTAAPLVIGMVLLIFLYDMRRSPRNIVTFGIAAWVAFLTWMVKGLLLYQNPVFPYVFGGLEWDAVQSANFNVSGGGLLSEGIGGLVQLIILPIAATLFGVEQRLPYGFTMGPFLFVLPFGLLLLWGRLSDLVRRQARILLPMALVLWAFWVVVAATSGIGGQIRLMLVGLPVIAILGGLVFHEIEQLPTDNLNVRFFVQAAIVMALVLGGFDHVHYLAKTRALPYHVGLISEDDYLLGNFGLLYNAMMQLDTLPNDSQVLMMWEDRSYYCPDHITCIPDALFDNWARPIRLGTSPDELLQQWQDEGIDYILLFDVADGSGGYSMWLDLHAFAREQNELFPQVFFSAVDAVWTDGVAYTLYEWRD